MKVQKKLAVAVAVFVVVAVSGSRAVAQVPAQTYKGLDVSVESVTRAVNVSLTDCPPGANSVRGVIKPGDATEFASVTVAFKVLPAFKPGMLAKPVLYDDAGKAYNTAQSFGDVGATPAFSCTFSYRVPKGAKVTRLAIDNVSFDLSRLAEKPQ
jgi:hypothetical protein